MKKFMVKKRNLLNWVSLSQTYWSFAMINLSLYCSSYAGDGGVMDTAAERERELVRQRLQEKSVRGLQGSVIKY